MYAAERTTKMTTMFEAVTQYRAGNNAGEGFAPYGVCDLVGGCIDGLRNQGWTVILESTNTDEVDVLRSPDGRLVAIGGTGTGGGAWAVEIEA